MGFQFVVREQKFNAKLYERFLVKCVRILPVTLHKILKITQTK